MRGLMFRVLQQASEELHGDEFTYDELAVAQPDALETLNAMADILAGVFLNTQSEHPITKTTTPMKAIAATIGERAVLMVEAMGCRIVPLVLPDPEEPLPWAVWLDIASAAMARKERWVE